MEDCSLFDMGFSGLKFTWTNRQDAQSNVRVRLDRAVCNSLFATRFDKCQVENVITTSSDHYAVIIDFEAVRDLSPNFPVRQPFRYEAMWRRAEDYRPTVEQAWKNAVGGPNPLQAACSSSLQKWSRQTFGAVR
jgi:hypothetical protein